MNPPTSPPDYTFSPPKMTEIDNLSDSDWLDIASGRDSDDNDSFTDQDSDRDEISSMPRSRRSSISNGESTSSDVEAWEGFVSDGGDEADAVTDMYPVPLLSPLGAEPIAVGFNPSIATPEAIAEEDERVKEALDQSFVGTLSSSRSSNLGSGHLPTPVHSSIRDLRLSFPDPLTSSRDELNRSYETVSSPTEISTNTSTDDDVTNEPIFASTAPMTVSLPIADPGSLATPEVQHHEVHHAEYEGRSADLDIVLYGTSSEIKWKFVQELIQKAAISSDHFISHNLRDNEKVQNVCFVRKSDSFSPLFNSINIVDRTNEGLAKSDVDNFTMSDCPSLAIVFLPTVKLPALSWHDAFLPVLGSSMADGDKTVMLQAAEDDWDLMAVPANRVMKLGTNKSPIFDPMDLTFLDAAHVYNVVRNIGQECQKTVSPRPLAEQVKSVNAVTLFALMSLIMGFAINTAFRPSAPAPTPTVQTPSSSNRQLWGILAPQPNRSAFIPSNGCGNSKTCEAGQTHSNVGSSYKDMALSVFIPGSTSLSVPPLPASKSLSITSTSKGIAVSVSSSSSSSKCHQCESGSSKAVPSSSTIKSHKVFTDIALRSLDDTALSEVPATSPVVSSDSLTSTTNNIPASTILLGGTIGTFPKSSVAAAASAATNINLNINSVSEVVLDATRKAINDVSEIVDAADSLLASLRDQTDSVIRQSKGKARAFGEQIQNLNIREFHETVTYRNNRAKKRAKELGAKGGALARHAKKVMSEGTTKAQKRAKGIAKTVVEGGTDMLERAQMEWGDTILRREDRRYERESRINNIRYRRGRSYDHL